MSNKKKEWGYLLIIIVVIIAAFSFDRFRLYEKLDTLFNGFFIMKLQSESLENFMTELFSIQATISTLGIAVVAFLSDMIKEDFYGYKISEYIMEKKHALFKHRTIIVAGLSACLLNYIAVSYKYYNVSLVIFYLSVVFILLLVIDNMRVFLGIDTIKKDIREYISSSPNDEKVDRVFKSMEKAIKENDLSTIEDNLDLLKSVFSSYIYKNKEFDNEKEIDYFLKRLYSTVNYLYKNTNGEYNGIFLGFYCIIYYDVNSINKEIFLYYEMMNHNYLKNIEFDKLMGESKLIESFYRLVYENWNRPPKSAKKLMDYSKPSITRITKSIYTKLFHDNNTIQFTINQKNEILAALYYYIMLVARINRTSQYDNDKRLKYEKQCLLFWDSIIYVGILFEYEEWEALDRIFGELDNIGLEEKNLYSSALLVLAYYTFRVEENREINFNNNIENKRNSIRQIIENNQSIIVNALQKVISKENQIQDLIDILWNHQAAYKEKDFDIKDIIYDFYFFLLLLKNDSDLLYKILKQITKGEIYHFYRRYVAHPEQMEWELKKFSDLFYPDMLMNENYTHGIKMLNTIITTVCKEYEQEENQKINKDLHQFEKNIGEQINNFFSQINRYLGNIPPVDAELKRLRYSMRLNLKLTSEMLEEQFMGELRRHIADVIRVILDENAIFHFKITYSENMAELFADLTELCDTIIGPDIRKGHKKRNEYEDAITYLNFIEIPGYDIVIGLDSKEVYLRVKIRSIKIRELTFQDIEDILDIWENTEYLIRHDIRLSFTSNELLDYMNSFNRQMEVNYQIEVKGGVLFNESGQGMESP